MGLNSLPVAFGAEKAKWITVATIDVTQLSVAAYLGLALHEPVYGGVLTALVLPQVSMRLAQQVVLSGNRTTDRTGAAAGCLFAVPLASKEV